VGSTLNLSASGVAGAVYSWSGPNNFSSNLQNPVIANVVPASAGIYSATVTANGCTSKPGTLDVNPIIAAPDAGSNSPVCEGTPVQLSATSIPGASYSWSGPNGFTAAVANPATAGSLANAGIYIVTASLAGCPALADTISVAINPAPVTPVVSGTPQLCIGGAIMLNASAMQGANYQWTGPNGFVSTIQNPVISNAAIANSGNYKVTVTTPGCAITTNSSMNVAVNPIPPTPVAGNNGPLCEGDALTLFSTQITAPI
jgi:hypothetical protein